VLDVLGVTGLELDSVTHRKPKHLQNPPESGGAESGAVSGGLVHIDPDLAHLINAWPDLPDAIKEAILAMVKAACPDRSRNASGKEE